MTLAVAPAALDATSDLRHWPSLDDPGPSVANSHPEVRAALARFATVDLVELADAALLDRADTKYLTSEAVLPALLGSVAGHYRVLVVRGARLSRYRTLYLDTPDLDLYLQHHNRRAVRSKVRSRQYVETGVTYLEVKRRTGRGRTVKDRSPAPELVARLAEVPANVDPALLPDPATLRPALLNAFTRITLVRRDAPERATIDLALRFASPDGSATLPNLAVVEVKQPRVDRASPLLQALRARGIRTAGFSKYCAGLALLAPRVRHNNFKPQLRELHRITRGHTHDN